jgi:hypothetical protein
LHFDKHSHCWPNLCKSCIVSHFFYRSGFDNCSWSKDYIISQPTPWGWFHPSSSRDIWMFTHK